MLEKESCLSSLAKAQIPLMEWLARTSFNSGNDLNGQHAKYEKVKEQLKRIDRLIELIVRGGVRR